VKHSHGFFHPKTLVPLVAAAAIAIALPVASAQAGSAPTSARSGCSLNAELTRILLQFLR